MNFLLLEASIDLRKSMLIDRVAFFNLNHFKHLFLNF